MKATINMNQTVKVSIASLALLAASFFTPLQAAILKNNPAGVNEIQAASNRLETLSLKIEKAIQFSTSDMLAYETEMFELETAVSSLEKLATTLEVDLRYVSPEVGENINDYEAVVALANLYQLNQRTENQIKYSAPSVTE